MRLNLLSLSNQPKRSGRSISEDLVTPLGNGIIAQDVGFFVLLFAPLGMFWGMLWLIEREPGNGVHTAYWRCFVCGIAMYFLGLLVLPVWPAHTPLTDWMNHYRDENGLGCCGTVDCRITPVRLVAQTPESTIVEIAGTIVLLGSKAIHVSETGDSWWCARSFAMPPTREATRCVFVVIGG